MKKSSFLIILTALLLMFSLVSCGENEIEDEYIYALVNRDSDFSTNFKFDYNGNTVYGISSVISENEDSGILTLEAPAKIVTVSQNGQISKTVSPKSPLGDDYIVKSFSFDCMPDGGYIADTTSNDKATLSYYIYNITRYDSNGEVVFFVDFKSETAPLLNGRTSLSTIITDKNGYIYLLYTQPTKSETTNNSKEKTILVLSPELKAAACIDVGTYPYGFKLIRNSDGEVCICYQSGDAVFTRGIDIEKAEFTAPEPVDGVGYLMPHFDSFGNVYYSDYYNFYKVVRDKNGNAVSEVLFDWVDLGLDESIVYDIRIKDDSEIFITLREAGQDDEYYTVKKVKASEVPKKITLIVAIDSESEKFGSRQLVKSLGRFNRKNQEYHIETVSYYTTEGGLTATQKLAQDIASGNSPDVIVFNGDLSYEVLASKNIFTNLYTFMEDDDLYTADYFLPCITKPYETSSGELMCIGTQYGAYTLSANTEIVGDIDKWTVSDLLNINSSLSDNEYFATYRFSDRNKASEKLLNMFLYALTDDFIDYENKTCDMTGLAELLELCKTAKLFNSKDATYDELIAVNCAISFKDWISVPYYVASYANEIPNEKYIGYPGATTPQNGVMIYSDAPVAIVNKTKHPDGAWEVVKEMLASIESEWQLSSIPNLIMPTTYGCFDKLYEVCDKTKVKINELLVTPSMTYIDDEYSSTSGKYYVFNKECCDFLLDSLINFKHIAIHDLQVKNIILEEASYYFGDVKPLDEIVDIISDRLQTMISE